MNTYRRDTALSALLFLLTLLSRIPFRSHILYHWDSVNFAYAMREFDVPREQPQPPGYILYVWLCRAVDVLFHDPQTTMVAISIVASALAVVALFYLGRAMFDRTTGLIAALLLATSPLFWFYGEIALPHSLDTLLVIVSVWWLYETMRGRHRYLYPAIVVLAVAGGVRQQTLVFLTPLILFALRRIGWRRLLAASALGTLLCLAWFVPLMVSSGGISAYLDSMSEYTARFNTSTSILMGAGWWGLRRNLRKLTMYTLYGWGAALWPFLVYTVVRLRRKQWSRDGNGDGQKAAFFALWLIPVLSFYTFIHMGQQGLVFVFLPALLLWGARGLVALSHGKRTLILVLTLVLVALNTVIFCSMPEEPLPDFNLRLLTRATLVNSDNYYNDRFTAIRARFAPDSTAILAANWHHVEYYLPEYPLIPLDVASKWEPRAGEIRNPSGGERHITIQDLGLGLGLELSATHRPVVHVIVFDRSLSPFNDSQNLTQGIPLLHHGQMEVLTLKEGQVLYCGDTFGIRSD